MLNSGIHQGWSSPSLPKLLSNDSYVLLTQEEASWIPVPMQYGGLIGSILSSCFINRIGRKSIILMSGVLFATSYIMLALAKALVVFLIARFVAGVADGIVFCSLPIYIVEISEPKVRGILLSGVSLAWCSGALFINVVGSYTSIPVASYISLSISVFFLATFWWMPETPHQLIMQGKLEKARSSLISLKKSKDVDEDLNRIANTVIRHAEEKHKLIHLFTIKPNRRSLFIVLAIKAAQQLCGFTCITFYAQTIFEQAGGVLSPKTTSIIYFGLFTISCGLCFAIIEKAGRKPLLIVSVSGTGVAMFVLATYLYFSDKINTPTNVSVIPLIFFLTYITFYAIGLFTAGLLIVSEILPLNIRPIGLCLASIFYEACSAVVIQLFQVSKDSLGLPILFYIFLFGCLLVLLFIIFYVPETTGIALEEIEDNLRKE